MPLIVKPISADLVKDHDFFGKSDPYAIILIGNEKQRSRTCSGGGKKPSWTDTFQFNTTDQLLRVQIYDDDFGKDDFIGEGTVNLGQFYSNPNRTENGTLTIYIEYIDLINKGRSAGRVLLSIQYQGQPMGGFGGNQGGWGGNQGGWGGNQGGWGGNQGGWGGNQGGWGGNQGGWGGNQGGGWNNGPPNQGGWNNGPPNQGGWNNGPPNQGGWNNGPPNQGGWNNGPPNQGGWGNQGPNQGWGNNQGNNQWGGNRGGW